jgi:HEAT repeat protein
VLEPLRKLFVALSGRDLPPDAWPAYWESHRERPVEEWLAEAAADRDPQVRRRACVSLGARQPDDVGRTALVVALGDADAEVRLAAALALAAWGDARAVPVLLEQLERSAAFAALGAFHDTTFGWDPRAEAVERAAARVRWAEWAKRSAFASEIR